jgi:hypothetical protein
MIFMIPSVAKADGIFFDNSILRVDTCVGYGKVKKQAC